MLSMYAFMVQSVIQASDIYDLQLGDPVIVPTMVR